MFWFSAVFIDFIWRNVSSVFSLEARCVNLSSRFEDNSEIKRIVAGVLWSSTVREDCNTVLA